MEVKTPVKTASFINLKQRLLSASNGAYYDLPSTLKTNATGFGFGEKKASYVFLKGTPSPNHYQVKRIYENFESVTKVAKNSGRDLTKCTFGIPYKAYENALLVINENTRKRDEESPERPKTT